MTRYGCRWPDASETGPITDSYRLATHYAKQHDGQVLDYDGDTGTPHKATDEVGE